YYDGVSGNGRAVQNVVFVDTADQYFSYGGEGVYNRADESITMTRNPLVMTVTRSDSTGADSLAVDSRTADSLAADPLGQPALRTDSLAADSLAPPTKEPGVVDTIYLTADTLFSRLIFLKDYVPRVFELDREGGELDEYDDEFTDDGYRDGLGGLDVLEPTDGGDTLTLERPSTLTGTPTDTAGVDSLAVPPTDSLQAPPTDSLQAPPTDSALLATHLERVRAVPLGAELGHDALARSLTADSLLREQAVIPTGGEADSLMADAVAALSRPSTDTIPSDSLANDTAKTRIIKAYYNVRLFKSDLQAVADSVYYGYPDSMMRFFGRPMIWAQGSQMTSDTIIRQVRNEQLDDMILMGNAFMVNTQLDSSKYNQVKGRRITGFFTNNALDRMFVDGNAESIYYMVDEKEQVYTNMYHSRSSRIKIVVDSNEIVEFSPIRRVDGKVYPMHLIPQEAEILNGFVWKPGDRPTSKEDLLARRRPPADAAVAVPADSAAAEQSPPKGRPISLDSIRIESAVQPPDSITRDSVSTDSLAKDSLIIDSLRKKPLPADSLAADSQAYIRPPRAYRDRIPLQKHMAFTSACVTTPVIGGRARRQTATAP